MKLRNWVYLILAVLLVFTVNTITFGAGSFTDTFSIGKNPASGSDVTLELGAGKVKYSPTEKKLKYANDGVNFSSIGSGGSAGGINILKNPSFEDVNGSAILNWNATGLTATTTTFTAGVEGDVKYVTITATSASQTFCSDFVTTPDTFSAGGQFEVQYNGGGSKFKAYVISSEGEVATPNQLADVTKWTKLLPTSFKFNTSQRVCFESLAAGSVSVNDVYMGTVKNSLYVPLDASLVGEIKYLPENVAPAGFIPAMGSSIGKSAGTYQGQVYFQLYKKVWSVAINTAGQPYYISAAKGADALTDWNAGKTITIDESGLFTRAYKSGTSGNVGEKQSDAFQGHWHAYYGKNDLGGGDGSNSSGSPTWGPAVNTVRQAISDGTNGTPRVASETRPTNVAKYVFIRYSPYIGAETAQTPEQAEWFIDANIGGANIGLAAGSVSTYTEITSSGLDLVINSQKGSASAKIACTNGVSPTGLTCVGNEAVGLAFTPPTTGLIEVCSEFTSYINATSSTWGAFQLVETDVAGNILQEGGSRVGTYNSSTSVSPVAKPHNTCGIFKVSSTSEKIIKLAYEKEGAGSLSIYADRNSADGQIDIRFTVMPILQNSPRAILTGDQVRTPNVKDPIHFKVRYGTGSASTACTAGPCSYTDSIGADGILSYVGRSSLGTYGLYTTKTWNKLFCTGNAFVGGRYLAMQPCSTVNGSTCTFATGDATTGYDSYGTLDCLGY